MLHEDPPANTLKQLRWVMHHDEFGEENIAPLVPLNDLAPVHALVCLQSGHKESRGAVRKDGPQPCLERNIEGKGELAIPASLDDAFPPHGLIVRPIQDLRDAALVVEEALDTRQWRATKKTARRRHLHRTCRSL
jgi:hypothetical protein